MQNVSQEYKDSMKSALRDRGYIRIAFGGVNSAAQNNAVISGEQISRSDPSEVFNNGLDDYVCATLEHNFTRVDGSMYFPTFGLEKAFIGDAFIEDGTEYSFTISFNGIPVDIDTMVFNFGDNYPLDFTITDDLGNSYYIENTSGRILEINQSFAGVTELVFTIYTMKSSGTHFRLYSLRFDAGFEYQNDMVLDSELNSSVSPIGEKLPQMNFSVDLINKDHCFDPDNPRTVLAQFNTTTEVNVFYGYQLADHIEWLQSAKLFVEKWQSDRQKATIYACDILQVNNKTYTKGTTAQTSLYDLAVDILTEMGITDYNVDPELALITTTNPIPVISCKEALQIVANAGRKKMFITRSGGIKIGDEIYSYEVSSNGTAPGTSNLNGILVDDTKTYYATLEKNFVKANGSKYFYSGSITTGYVSNRMSDEYKLFNSKSGDIYLTERTLFGNVINLPYTLNAITTPAENPILTVTMEASVFLQGVFIKFGETYATRFLVRCLDQGTVVEEVYIENASTEAEVNFANGFGNVVEIEFLETVGSYNRVRVDYLQVLRRENIYNFEDIDLLSYPAFQKLETIKKISVLYYSYQLEATEEKLLEEEITVTDVNQEFEFIMKEASGNYTYSVSSGNYTIVRSGAYSVVAKFSTTGTITFTINGYKYTSTEQVAEEVLNAEGKEIVWKNPLINSKTMAEALVSWLKEYYMLEGIYSFQTRGNPEIDCNDEATQIKYTGDLMRVLITDVSLGFDGAFSGSVKTLKEENIL